MWQNYMQKSLENCYEFLKFATKTYIYNVGVCVCVCKQPTQLTTNDKTISTNINKRL